MSEFCKFRVLLNPQVMILTEGDRGVTPAAREEICVVKPSFMPDEVCDFPDKGTRTCRWAQYGRGLITLDETTRLIEINGLYSDVRVVVLE